MHVVQDEPKPNPTPVEGGAVGFEAPGDPGPGFPSARFCGALGRYEQARVERIAAHLGPGLRPVHRDRRSALLLDRDPLRWGGEEERGLAWSQSPRPPRQAATWGEAATALDACGLALRGRRRIVHSSVSGLAPVFWMDDGGATYFCSRIDPLVQASTRPLRPDWEAWATILRLGFALGSRTPFAEIRRLEPYGTLERGPSGGVATTDRWPWAEVELADPDSALDELAEALRAELGALERGSAVMGLSGGADSRLLLAALVASDRQPRALTVPGNWGRDEDERLAAEAAAAVAVPHEVLPLQLDGYWRDAQAFAEATDCQQALEWAWLAPVIRRLAALPGAIAVDGLAGDYLVHGKFATREVLAAPDDGRRNDLLWLPMHRGRNGRRLLARNIERAITERARAQLDAEGSRWADHPAAYTLAFYRTRGMRGMSGGVHALNRAVPTMAPYTTHAVATAALRCPPEAKLDGAFQRAAIARLAPALADVPVTSFGAAPEPAIVPERRRDEPALEGYLELLRESPFRRWFRRELREAVDAGDPVVLGGLGPKRLVNGYALHSLWLRRYGGRLRSASPRNLLG